MEFYNKTKYNIDDIYYLIESEAEESIYLDFKAAGSLSKEPKKKEEIAKDVSAFANSDGGIIVYGLEERDHKAHKLSYIDGNTYTKEWLEQVIQDNIQRRIENLEIFPIRENGDMTKTIYVVKIPRSSNSPHMSADKCYYKRNNFRSVKMEEYEVRDLFYRESVPDLRISEYLFDKIKEDSDCITFCILVQVANISNTIATLYKLNCYISAFENIHNYYGKYISEFISPTIVNDNKLKISEMGKCPLFPNEVLDMLRVEFQIKKDKIHDFVNNTTFEFVLMFANKTDKVSFLAKDFNFN